MDFISSKPAVSHGSFQGESAEDQANSWVRLGKRVGTDEWNPDSAAAMERGKRTS